ncbi:MAG: VapC toxin family PIN domain ribonuclease [Methylococcales bacterium]
MQSILRKNSIIADSGYWVALGNTKDRFHQKAMSAFQNLEEIPFVTWPVITEVSYMLYRDVGYKQQQAFIGSVKDGSCQIFSLEIEHFTRLESLMHTYRDLPMDLADASLVILAEELGHGRILSTDQRDFNTYRWKNHKPFENLLIS